MTKRTPPKEIKKKEEQLPEQKLGDTPVAPWQMPGPAQKQAARPVREALTEALADVDTEEKAEAVVTELERSLGEVPAETVTQAQPQESVSQAASDVKQAAAAAPPDHKPEAVLAETARVLEATRGVEREAVSEAVQEVFSPEQQGEPGWYRRRRDLLRKAVMRHLKPIEALDANLFLRINHLPHTHFTNGLFYFITFIFGGGVAWFMLMGANVLRRRRWDWHLFRSAALPLTIATALVEYPIKTFFRRRRPFISIVRAIVIGKKPGTFSFPSGHSASAFAGAWVMRQHFPRYTPLWYFMAVLVAFSRVYLGDHYPGDVVSGSLLGHFFARLFARLLGRRR